MGKPKLRFSDGSFFAEHRLGGRGLVSLEEFGQSGVLLGSHEHKRKNERGDQTRRRHDKR